MRIANKATKGKGKRWMKGSSSSSNPESKRHRLQARCLPSVTPLATSQSSKTLLTENLLSQHNRIESNKSDVRPMTVLNDNSDAESIGNQSFASVWTNCSNVSFNKLLSGFDSSSPIHKQMLSVLAAITETIRSNGGKETETEYFAAFITALESVDNEETLTAILSLIQMVIRRLPSTVIRLKFSETSKLFVEYLAKYIKGENGLIVRSLTDIIATLLQQQEYIVWELSSTKHIFEIILSVSVHNKPRIRKCAQKAIARILKSNTNQVITGVCHPIAKTTADFCIRKLENNGTDDINSILYILTLLTDILSVLPNPSLKKCCESVLTQMTFGNVLVVSTAFKAFYLLFASKPHEDILTADLNAKLISALYDYQPNINDSQPLCAWFQAIKQAFLNLYRIDKSLCFNHLPKLFSQSMACLLSDAKEVHICITNDLKLIYTNCVEPSALEIDKQIISKVFSTVDKLLQYEFCSAWGPIFGLVSHPFNANFAEFTTNIINKLITIRESYDCVYATDIDHTIGRAIQVFGPKYIIQLCPLDLNDESTDVSHNWLIPVLRDNVKNTELLFFAEYFIPLITVLQQSCKSLESNGSSVTLKASSILLSQIWSLLPSFCIHPNDFEISFKKLAQTLGLVLSNIPSLRGYILSAFRNISKSFGDEIFEKELSRFSKNFTPILFNIYTKEQNTDEEINQRFSVYQVIQIFLSVSENSLILSLYSKLIEKLDNFEENSVMRQSLMDLIRAFVPYVRSEDLNQIYSQLVIPFIGNNKLITEQKKAFRILEEICKNESNVCRDFLSNKIVDIINALIESLSKCLSSSKSYVLKALKNIIESNLSNTTFEWKQLFLKIIPKTLDCFLINSQKVKIASNDLMISIAKAYKSLNGGNPNELFEILISFLHKTEYSSSAVIICLTKLYSEFQNEIPKHIECDLIENIITSLSSDNRQTVQTAIDFLKYFFKKASIDQLSAYLQLLINKLSNINRQHKNHFRVKIRELFVRLVRKYGHPMISKMIPEEYQKVLKNIRKIEDRKRKKNEKDSESDDERHTSISKIKRRDEFEDIIADSSEDESEDEEKITNVSRKSNKPWIKEESNENEIIDLLSKNLSKNILYENPENKTKDRKENFKVSADGKLIIEDFNQKSKGAKRAREEDEEMEENEIEEDVVSMNQSVKTSKSKSSGYRTGGRGIHRPVDKESGVEYKSNKAKGDMKRKGRPDPYAYIPLNRQTLNRRKKAKMSGRFNNLVKSAKKGAQTGANNRAKKMRKN